MRITIVESPYDSGHRGERMGAGPTHLLESGLVGRLQEAGHDVTVAHLDLGPGLHPEIVAAAELMRRISRAAAEAVADGRLPIVLSGNCNAAVGAVSGLGRGTAVLWFDAHGDLNTPETTPSGYFDGMAYAMLLGAGFSTLAETIPGFSAVPGPLAALAGARDLDPPEEGHLAAWGVEAFPVARLRTDEGRAELAEFARRGDRLYVHVDLDVLDPSALTANRYAAAGGLTGEELVGAVGAAVDAGALAGIGFASYDPAADEADAAPGIVHDIIERVVPA